MVWCWWVINSFKRIESVLMRLTFLTLRKSYLHGTQNPEIIFDFLLNLIHITTAKSHITFPQVCSRASQIIFVLKHNPFTDVYLYRNRIQILTRDERIEPKTVPSSYRPNFSSTLLRTDVNFATRPLFILTKVFSIKSSIFVWYLCWNKSKRLKPQP